MAFLTKETTATAAIVAEARVSTTPSTRRPPAAHVAAGDVAAQQGIAVTAQMVADGGEETILAQKVGDALLETARPVEPVAAQGRGPSLVGW